MSALLLALSLATPVLVTASPDDLRVGALVLPADAPSEALCPALESYAAAALEAFPHVRVQKTQELFSAPADADAQAAYARAEASFKAALRAYDAHQDDASERLLKGALREYGHAAAALRECGHLCDATALMAASLERRGDLEGAKEELLNLLALSPTGTVAGPRFRPQLLKFRDAVAKSADAALRGGLSITTQPAGARVYVDGTQVGTSPVQIPALATGKHLLRVERAGFRVYGQLVQVTQEDQALAIPLVPTPSYGRFQADAEKMASELQEGEVGTSARWGAQLGLSRLLVGALHESEPGTGELLLTLVDVRAGRKLATRRMGFRDNAYGQLKLEVEHAVTALVNEAQGGGTARVDSQDPLDNRHGTETWNQEDRGGRSRTHGTGTKAGDDPLNRRNGTEGW